MEENSWMKKFVAVVSAILAMPQVVAAKEAVQDSNQASINLPHKLDIADAALRSSPPLAVAGASAAGVQINEVIMWATLVYLILQIGFLLYKWIRLHNETLKKEDKQ